MTYDLLVVGAGSAGAIVATRVAERSDKSVILIEAGPDYPDLADLPDELRYGHATGARVSVSQKHMWPYVAQATPTAPPMAVPRGRVTGGSSAVNGQIFLRGLPEDYDGWAEQGNDLWDYRQVLPYLLRLESDPEFANENHNVDGRIGVHRYPREQWLPSQRAFFESCLALGFAECPDANAPSSTGVGPYPLNNPNGIRVSTALGYLPHARGLPNFSLLSNTTVRRVLFDDDRAVGVEVDGENGPETIDARHVVLSGGAIGSPHLLLLSGVGPAQQLREFGIDVVQDRPGVGKHLQDHCMVELFWKTKPEFHAELSDPRVQVVLRYTAEGSDIRNDMWITALTFLDEFKMYSGIHLALSEGELTLASRDPHVHPNLDYGYATDENDRRRLRIAARLGVEIASQPALQEILAERIHPSEEVLGSDSALDEWIQYVITSSQHIACTARMGPASNPDAVVDQFCNVHGVAGLSVADASVLPRMIRANTNVTTMMIGERVASFILDDEARSAARSVAAAAADA